MNDKEFDDLLASDRGRQVTVEDMREKLKDQHIEGVVSWFERPGAAIFAATIEWELYQPQTAANSLFQMGYVQWGGETWSLILYQVDDRKAVREIAYRLGLRLANAIPQIIPVGLGTVMAASRRLITPTARMFPLRSENLFTLEFREERTVKPDDWPRLHRIQVEQLIALYQRFGVPEEKWPARTTRNEGGGK